MCVCGHTRHAVKSTERHVSRVSIGYLEFLARGPTLLEKVRTFPPKAAQYVQLVSGRCTVFVRVHVHMCGTVARGRALYPRERVEIAEKRERVIRRGRISRAKDYYSKGERYRFTASTCDLLIGAR